MDTFTFTRFEPQGMVDHPNIKSATSVVDYIFRVVALEYLNRTDLVQVPPKVEEKTEAVETKAPEVTESTMNVHPAILEASSPQPAPTFASNGAGNAQQFHLLRISGNPKR